MHYRRVICAFQPHTYSRTRALFQDFVDELRTVDQVVLTDIYAAREQNSPRGRHARAGNGGVRSSDAPRHDYERVTHELADTMENATTEPCLGVDVCKNLFLCKPAEDELPFMYAAAQGVSYEGLSHQIGSVRLSFRAGRATLGLLHCTPGSATILGLMNDDENRVQLLIIDKETHEAE